MTLARQSQIEAEGVPNDEAAKTREGPGDLRSAKQVSEANRGRVGGPIWQSRSPSFANYLRSGLVFALEGINRRGRRTKKCAKSSLWGVCRGGYCARRDVLVEIFGRLIDRPSCCEIFVNHMGKQC